MTNPSGSDRLNQIEAILLRVAQQQETNTREASERMTAIEQLTQSNSRAIQAMADQMAEERLEREEFREQITRLDDVVIRLTAVQEGVNNLLASLDSDRPTILSQLNKIENKVDRLLQQENRSDPS